MRSRRAIPDNRIKVDQARTQFDLWLSGARPEQVLAATSAEQARLYRLPAREIECKLLARQDVLRRQARHG